MRRFAPRHILPAAGFAACAAASALHAQQPYMVKKINPKSAAGLIFMTPVGNRLFFNANDGVHGQELWISDGTLQGTYMVMDIVPGIDGSEPMNLAGTDELVFFHADDNVNGLDLWVSDGTDLGTRILSVVFANREPNPPEQCVFFGFGGSQMAALKGVMLLGADDGISGVELWRSDGTPEGTFMVKDIVPGPESFRFQQLTPAGDLAIFAGADGTGTPGFDVWRTDGTAEGTFRLKDLAGAIWFTNVNGTVFFQGFDGVTGDELWKTDGTPEGTVLVKDIHPTGESTPIALTAVGDTLFFSAFHPDYGRELWKSDGTEEGTVLVKDIDPGTASGGVGATVDLDGVLFFGASNGIDGSELWKSDGTEEGTVMVADINPGPDSSVPKEMVAANGRVFFTADDGVHGRESWVSDGTEDGTKLIGDFRPGTAAGGAGGLVLVGDLLFFSGFGELWALDTRQPPAAIPALSPPLAVAGALAFLTAGIAILVRRQRREMTLRLRAVVNCTA